MPQLRSSRDPAFWFIPALLACVLVLSCLCLFLIQRQSGAEQNLLREQERLGLDQAQLQFRQDIERKWQDALKTFPAGGILPAGLRPWSDGLGPDFFGFWLDDSGILIYPNYELIAKPHTAGSVLAASLATLFTDESPVHALQAHRGAVAASADQIYRRMIAAWEQKEASSAIALALQLLSRPASLESGSAITQSLAATAILLELEEISERTMARHAAMVDLWLKSWQDDGAMLSPGLLPWLRRLQEQCRRRNERESWLVRERQIRLPMRQIQWADKFLPRLNLLLRRHLYNPARAQLPLQVLNSDSGEDPFLTLCRFQNTPELRLVGLVVDLDAFCQHLEASLDRAESGKSEVLLQIHKADFATVPPSVPSNTAERQQSLSEARVLDPWAPQFIVEARPRDIRSFQRRAFHKNLMYLALTLLTITACVLVLFFGNRALKEQHRLSKLRTDFLTNVSHELRTPLTAIRLHAETMERQFSGNSSPAASNASTILEEVDRLGVLINDVLEFTRIENDKKRFVWEAVDLVSVTRDSLQLFSQQLSDLGFETRVDLPESLALQRADRAALKQCAVNLISNAIKFSPEEKRLEIRLSTERNQGVWTFEDRGIGIAPVDRPHIFEKFYRGANLDPAMSGTGLGLTLCKAFVEAHGGRISWEEPVSGLGSRFVIHLPI